jgi:hypothetical protein
MLPIADVGPIGWTLVSSAGQGHRKTLSGKRLQGYRAHRGTAELPSVLRPPYGVPSTHNPQRVIRVDSTMSTSRSAMPLPTALTADIHNRTLRADCRHRSNRPIDKGSAGTGRRLAIVFTLFRCKAFWSPSRS